MTPHSVIAWGFRERGVIDFLRRGLQGVSSSWEMGALAAKREQGGKEQHP